jgi:hypothetical protein
MATDPRTERQQATLKATTTLLRYWQGPPEVRIDADLPKALADAAAVLDGVSGADVLRVIASNKPLLSALMR